MISFEQLVPAKQNVPLSAQSIAVINNLPENGNLVGNGKEMVAYGKIGTETLAKGLAEAEYFPEVVLCDAPVNALSERQDLTTERVDSLCRALQVEWLLTLDEFPVLVYENKGQFPAVPYGLRVSEAQPQISIYKASHTSSIARIAVNDTLYWGWEAVALPTFFSEVAINMTPRLVSQFVPTWKEVYRYFFENGATMRDVMICLRENDVEEAYKLCMNAYNTTKNEKSKAKIAYNMAVINERMGNISTACEWIETARKQAGGKLSVKEQSLFQEYKEQLTRRKAEETTLRKQMATSTLQ